MNTLSRVVSPSNWPLWLKITLGLAVAALIPLVIGAFIIQSGFGAYSLDATKTNIGQTGTTQLETLNRNLVNGRRAVVNLTLDEELTSEFVDLLLLGGGTTDRTLEVSSDMQREAKEGGILRALRLVDTRGLIVAQASTEQVLSYRGFDTETSSFINAQNASQSNIDQTVTVSGGRSLTIEFTHTLRDGNNAIIGHLIGTVDENIAVLPFLAASGRFDSFLITPGQNPLVVGEQGLLTDAALADSVATKRALAGQTATTAYLFGTRQPVEMIGFYAPVSNPIIPNQTLFALVTETPVSTITNPTVEYLGGARLFVGGLGLAIIVGLLIVLANQIIIPPLISLREAMQAAVDGDLNYPLQYGERQDEIGMLNAAFVDMRSHIRGLIEELESRIASRTRDISATQEVGRFAASQRDVQTLLDQVVELIVEKFPDIYHAQIFLLDSDRQFAMLRSSTGEPGKIMLARGHKLAVGSLSVIGQVTGQGEVVVARDTGTSQVHQRNDLLPLTRAELAIPLKIGTQTIGALDVQSRIRDTFGKDEVAILQTMADQVAVAIENARLYQESVRRLEEIERINRTSTFEAWQEYLYAQRERQLSSQSGITSTNDLSALRKQAIQQNRIVVGSPTPNQTIPIAVPVQLRGQTLGAVEWEIPANDLNENKLQLAQELANRLAISLDNARLFQESQRAAERERVVNTIAARLTPQTEISDILQTAVREVGQALRAPNVTIRLHRTNGHSQPNEN
ncbi:MAG: GAF domain-containing protein [Chloroflexi bacterium]|nr:GAF domain-containing protein [Chloroflexota bacterium]MCC6894797.1 GAF domain-containing protein [Anaerolineae bacterium]